MSAIEVRVRFLHIIAREIGELAEPATELPACAEPAYRTAQALIALGRNAEGDALLEQVANGKWHTMWQSTVYQAKNLLERGKQQR